MVKVMLQEAEDSFWLIMKQVNDLMYARDREVRMIVMADS
jgi:hypothetical protein